MGPEKSFSVYVGQGDFENDCKRVRALLPNGQTPSSPRNSTLCWYEINQLKDIVLSPRSVGKVAWQEIQCAPGA